MKLVKKLGIATASAVISITGVGASSAAQAVQLFDFQYSFPSYETNSTGISASGTLTTTDLDPIKNNYTITGIAGTRTIQGMPKTLMIKTQINKKSLVFEPYSTLRAPVLGLFFLYFIVRYSLKAIT
ncbi:MAG: hypothetical protein KME50_02440 [Nostoc desertorum CM1-VF14]|jgi:hypothetical protein|nr:hypothetical protein [Nostoc desertorum CM1-VF14]